MAQEKAQEKSPDQKIVSHNVVQLRAKPEGSSERVSQLRIGQMVTVLSEEGSWVRVEGEDTYRGWAEARWFSEVTDTPRTEITAVFADMRQEPDFSSPLLLRLPMLARVHVEERRINGWVHVMLPGGALCGWLPEFALAPLPQPGTSDIAETAIRIGREFLGTPYLWGGTSAYGLDCSGFVQYCYEYAGILLRRDADIQRDDPRFVPVEMDERQPGDLVFFGKNGRITHVGMHFAGDTFIHSAGGPGVTVTEWGDSHYSPIYVDARRLDPARGSEPLVRFESDTR